MVYTEVDIKAPPSRVRAVVLDFDNLPKIHTRFMLGVDRKIETKSDKHRPLEEGDQITVRLPYFQLEATVLISNAQELRWGAATWCGLIAGEHYFLFLPSKTIPGGTRFVHGEDHGGPTSFLFQPGYPMYRLAQEAYNSYTLDVKRAIEGGAGGGGDDGDSTASW